MSSPSQSVILGNVGAGIGGGSGQISEGSVGDHEKVTHGSGQYIVMLL